MDRKGLFSSGNLVIVVFCCGEAVYVDREEDRLGYLKPEEKVAIAIDMTSASMRVCEGGIKAREPGIDDERLLRELGERVSWGKRNR